MKPSSTPVIRKRLRRTRALMACLVVFVFLAQPALALASLSLRSVACEMLAEDCCSVPAEFSPEPAAGEDACCSDSSESPKVVDADGLQGCGCRFDAGSFPDFEPAILPNRSRGSSVESPGLWLVAQQLLSSQSLHWRTDGFDLAGAKIARSTGMQAAQLRPNQWQRLLRGVAGYLAYLSTARI